jgi:sporulation protein YqfC
MGFFDNMKESFGICDLSEGIKNKVVLVGFEAGYFDCVVGIIGYSDTEISLALKKGKIIVYGKDLYIKKFCEGDVVVCGKITKIERC